MKKVVVGLVGAVVLIAGSVWLTSGAAGDGSRFKSHRVKVYFTRQAALSDDCAGTKAFDRRTVGPDVLHDTLNWLLRGPRAGEKDEGAASLFSKKTAGYLNSVSIEGGIAYVDFDDLRRVIPGASTSCGGASFLTELKRTAKQFPSVERVIFSFEGSAQAFYNWLQMEPPN